MQIPIHELHADMIKLAENVGLQEAKDEKSAVIISETMLRRKLPSNVKLMSYQKRNVCQCEICTSADIMQNSLNEWRKNI